MVSKLRRMGLLTLLVAAACLAVILVLEVLVAGSQIVLANGNPSPTIKQSVNGKKAEENSEFFVPYDEELEIKVKIENGEGNNTITSVSVIPDDIDFVKKSESENVTHYEEYDLGGGKVEAVVYEGPVPSHSVEYSFSVISDTLSTPADDLPVQKSPSEVFLVDEEGEVDKASMVNLVFLPTPIVKEIFPTHATVDVATTLSAKSNQDDYVKSWTWTIDGVEQGDEEDNSKVISHIFEQTGEATVKLIIENKVSVSSDSFTHTIEVISPTLFVPLVSSGPEPECVPKNTSVEEAGELIQDDPIEGKYCADEKNKERIYWFEPENSGIVKISLKPDVTVDLDLYLYRDDSGSPELLASSRKSGFGVEEEIEFKIDAEKHYVRVYRFKVKNQGEDNGFTVEWE